MGNNTSIIETLKAQHQKKHPWKNPRILLSLWAIGHILYFIAISAVFSRMSPHASLVFMAMVAGSSAMGWVLFTRELDRGQGAGRRALILTLFVVATLVLAFLYEDVVIHNLAHTRPLLPAATDGHCFAYTLLTTLLPLGIFPFLMRSFFVPRGRVAMAFLSWHLALLGTLVTEFTCPNRELAHLLFGHQASVFGVFAVMALYHSLIFFRSR